MSGTRREQLADLLTDLRITRKGLQVRKTGHMVPLEWGTVIDVKRWMAFYNALRRAPKVWPVGPKVFFTPQEARPWYFSRVIVETLGAKVVSKAADADLVWGFDDATYSHVIAGRVGQIVINKRCTDVSKTKVAEASNAGFGTILEIDPTGFDGAMVEKSEINGAHDGQIVTGPCKAKKDTVYQRVIDNRIDGDLVEDLRTTIMGGKPILVFRKQRPVDKRFANSNANVLLAKLEDIFSVDEIEQITKVASELKLDAGGLDVLRDRKTGELFVVDANKTDMGPPLALPVEEKLQATRMMAEALAAYLTELGWDGSQNNKSMPQSMTPVQNGTAS